MDIEDSKFSTRVTFTENKPSTDPELIGSYSLDIFIINKAHSLFRPVETAYYIFISFSDFFDFGRFPYLIVGRSFSGVYCAPESDCA